MPAQEFTELHVTSKQEAAFSMPGSKPARQSRGAGEAGAPGESNTQACDLLLYNLYPVSPAEVLSHCSLEPI